MVSMNDQSAIDAIVNAVEARLKAAEDKWGFGRLPTLVPLEWAERYGIQRRKFNTAVWSWNARETVKHGDALIRGIDKLEALAIKAGGEPLPPEQWEFEGPEGLIILVRDRARVGQAATLGRKAQVWSVDEIAALLQNHPLIVAVKSHFNGAVVESANEGAKVKRQIRDSEEGLPI